MIYCAGFTTNNYKCIPLYHTLCCSRTCSGGSFRSKLSMACQLMLLHKSSLNQVCTFRGDEFANPHIQTIIGLSRCCKTTYFNTTGNANAIVVKLLMEVQCRMIDGRPHATRETEEIQIAGQEQPASEVAMLHKMSCPFPNPHPSHGSHCFHIAYQLSDATRSPNAGSILQEYWWQSVLVRRIPVQQRPLKPSV